MLQTAVLNRGLSSKWDIDDTPLERKKREIEKKRKEEKRRRRERREKERMRERKRDIKPFSLVTYLWLNIQSIRRCYNLL